MSSNLENLQSEICNSDLSAFIVRRADAFGGESIAPRDERLQWLTGFTGSAGLCIATASKAAIFVDGRYRSQVRQEVKQLAIEIRDSRSEKISQWLRETLPNGGLVGYDPWLHSQRDIEKLKFELDHTSLHLQSSINLVDRIWADQPASPSGHIFLHEVEFAGETHQSKRSRISEQIREKGCSATVVALADCVCWLLNIRGSDAPHVPVVHAIAILWDDSRVDLYVDQSTFETSEKRPALLTLGEDVRVRKFNDLSSALSELSGKVLVDPATCPAWIFQRLKKSGADLLSERDPCVRAKAAKNPREIECTTNAHVRDGAAMSEALAWLSAGDVTNITELDVVRKIGEVRERTDLFHDLSFDTIAASGPNGAVIHYRATPESNRTVDPERPLLIDSGSQYRDGTTDVTRTMSIAETDDDIKRCYTLVLKGLIAISRAQWPNGLTGRDLDPIARYPLWLAGLDYDHGTGHGVGHFLNVHEGPQAIARRCEEPLRLGMVVSLEPGYYRENEFGIRLENIVVVEQAQNSMPSTRAMLRFRTLTLVPFQKKMILQDTLTSDERSWLNEYHSETLAKVAPHCSSVVKNWLEKECDPL